MLCAPSSKPQSREPATFGLKTILRHRSSCASSDPVTSQAWKRRLSKTRAGIAMQQLLMAATSSPLSGHSLPCVRIWARNLLLPKLKTYFALFFALRQCAATLAESNPSAASLCAFSRAALPLQLCYLLASSRAPASTPTSQPPTTALHAMLCDLDDLGSFAGRSLFLQLRCSSHAVFRCFVRLTLHFCAAAAFSPQRSPFHALPNADHPPSLRVQAYRPLPALRCAAFSLFQFSVNESLTPAAAGVAATEVGRRDNSHGHRSHCASFVLHHLAFLSRHC
jgi:hypothetical protein